MTNKKKYLIAVAGLGLLALGSTAQATSVLCDTDAPNLKNYMQVPDTQVSACLDAGLGTLSGNTNGNGNNPDEFLTGVGTGYSTASKTGGTNTFNLVYNAGLGTWSFDSTLWSLYPTGTKLAIGFKFGTGNTPDEYFVFQLVGGISSGTFEWFPIAVKGNGDGGLSHMILYASRCASPTEPGCGPPDQRVPEPGSLLLLGLGLLGLSAARRQARTR